MELYNKYEDVPVDETERIELLMSRIKDKAVKDKINERASLIRAIGKNSLHFVFYIIPKATPRPRFDPKRKIVYVKGAAVNKKFFKEVMKNYDIKQIVTPIKFTCDCYLPTPSSMTKSEQILAEMGLIRPISKPDWDNLGKSYSDMIQGVLIQDDSLIIEGVSRKFYSAKPRVEITIEYLKDFDSKFNENKIIKRLRGD